MLISWVYLSHSIYTREILKPGEPYELNGKEYILANIPINGIAYKIKDDVSESLRSLLVKTSQLLDKLDISWWITGGTLLGVERHNILNLPWDDDVDIAVEFEKRDYIFSNEFALKALKYNLDTFTLFPHSSKSADRHGGVVRVQHFGDEKGKRFESLDIFFWKKSIDENKVCKLDGWTRNGKLVENLNETFNYSDLFPLRRILCEGVDISIPNNPRMLLEKQYSKNIWDSIQPRPLLISHAFPIRFCNLFFIRGSFHSQFVKNTKKHYNKWREPITKTRHVPNNISHE